MATRPSPLAASAGGKARQSKQASCFLLLPPLDERGKREESLTKEAVKRGEEESR